MHHAMVLSALAVAGILSHWLYFNRGEHHMQAPELFYSFVALVVGTFAFETYIEERAWISAVQATTVLSSAFLLPLLASIVIYRTFFHRLRKFPGPVLARVSKLWHVYHARHSRNPQFLHTLYREYGPFVRTGPSEVTIFLPEALPALDGPQTTCTKSDWYDITQPLRPLSVIRNVEEHASRRRVWNNGFSVKALQDYDDRIIKYVSQLENHLATTAGQPVHVHDWFYWFAFDVMGDLALAKSFNMLIDGKWHYAISMMNDFTWLVGPFSPAPWLMHLAFAIPGAAQGWKNFIQWSKERMNDRMLLEPEKRDVASWLIEASREHENTELRDQWLYGDTIDIVVAGSDTIGFTLTLVFYYLALKPTYQTLIRDEISSGPLPSDVQSLQTLPILQSIINETLRLHPPVPTYASRITGPEGLTIGGEYIPPHTTTCTSKYTIARLETAFERPNEFIPERWTTKPEMVRDKRAFAPFSQGRRSCIGKNLALREISCVIATIISKYYVELAPGEEGIRVVNEIKDQFTAAPGPLDLVFKIRETK